MTDLIQLRDGPIVRADAIHLAIDLSARGHELSAKDGLLYITNGSALTAADTAAIRPLRRHLLAIAAYQAPEAR